MKVFQVIVAITIIWCIFLAFWGVLAMLPYSIAVQAKCYSRGYSDYQTTILLDGYCVKDKQLIKAFE